MRTANNQLRPPQFATLRRRIGRPRHETSNAQTQNISTEWELQPEKANAPAQRVCPWSGDVYLFALFPPSCWWRPQLLQQQDSVGGRGEEVFQRTAFSLVHQRPQRWTIWICFKAMSGFSRFSTRSVLILLRALTADACPRSLEQVKLPRSENHRGRSLSRHQFRLGYWRREVRSGVGELDLYPGLNSICDLVLGDAYE